MKAKKIGVVLCGSGFLDGSEIRESVGALWALSQQPVEIQCFAPDSEQFDVMNCLTRQPVKSQARNMLVEAARIARGQILPLGNLDPAKLHGLVFPGGFGVAKNLCNFALVGARGVVCAEVQRAIDPMFAAKKPMGFICIAPTIAALAFKGAGLELTLGARSEAALEIEKLGHKHIECQADECHVDRKHNIVSTPAYMCDDAPLHEIFTGIKKLVEEVVRLT
jgi:enhancing lycopene biosynthesis protein 2